MEQEGLHVGAARLQRRLQDGAGDGTKRILPFPAEVAVEFLQMIEVVLDADGVVVARPHVEHHATLARHAIEEAGEVGHVREIRRQLRHQQGNVHALEVGRERQLRQFGVGRAEDRHVMAQLATGLDPLVDGRNVARPRIDPGDEQDLHGLPRADD